MQYLNCMKSNRFKLIALSVFCLILGHSVTLNAQVLNQDGHLRVLLIDTTKASFIQSRAIISRNEVIFEMCGDETLNQGCTPLTDQVLTLNDLDRASEAVIGTLNEYYIELVLNPKQSWFNRFLGAPQKKLNALNLEMMIEQLESEGLANWALLTEQNMSQEVPQIHSKTIVKEIAERISKVLNRKDGWDKRTRTADLYHVKVAL
jgi:hypothetical protein